MSRSGDHFTAHLPLQLDEWGTGTTWLPDDRYAVHAQVGGREEPVHVTPELWRGLPAVVTVGAVTVEPQVAAEGALELLVVPVDRRASAGPRGRQRLRDHTYQEARSRPLRDLVLFETFAGRAGGDNPGALCQELSSRVTGMDLVCSVVDLSIPLPEGARPVIRFSAEYVEALARARWLIVNAALPYWFRKRPDQLCVQTWHGSPLKRIAHDRPHQDFFNWHHRHQLLTAREGWDQLLSQSPFCTRSLRSAFRYDGPVLESGYPRNDLLLSPSAETVRQRTRRSLGVADDERVVLYAPTWRDNVRVGRVFQKVLYLDPHRVVDELPGTVVLLRGHYNSLRAAEQDDPDRRVVDVTRYPDIADLYLAADALVTDYSSVFFDFVLTDKPMVFLAPDLVEYRDENRGFYLDYHEVVPGPVCLTTDEVVADLAAGDGWAERRAAFRREFAPFDDGGASARVIDALLGDAPLGDATGR
jgi:CDP-glycerol glycerophosphotransferase